MTRGFSGPGRPGVNPWPAPCARRRSSGAGEFTQVEGADELAGGEIGGHRRSRPAGRGRSSAAGTGGRAPARPSARRPRAPTAITAEATSMRGTRARSWASRPELAAPREHDAEQRHVDDGRDAGGERRADMLERHHQRQVEGEVQHQRDDADLHRHRGVAAGEEARAPAPSPARRRAGRARRRRATGPRAGRFRASKWPRTNSTVMIGTAADGEADRGRQGEEQRVFERPVHRRRRRLAPRRSAPGARAAAACAVPTAVPIVASGSCCTWFA